MTEEKFNENINRRNADLLLKIMNNMDKSVFNYLPMVLKAIF